MSNISKGHIINTPLYVYVRVYVYKCVCVYVYKCVCVYVFIEYKENELIGTERCLNVSYIQIV